MCETLRNWFRKFCKIKFYLNSRTLSDDGIHFKILPKYLPEGESDAVTIMLATKPNLYVNLYWTKEGDNRKVHWMFVFRYSHSLSLKVQLLTGQVTEEPGYCICMARLLRGQVTEGPGY